MVKDIGRYFKHIQWKISNPTFKKPVLSSSADHASPASNLTGTFISSKLDNKQINTKQNKTKQEQHLKYRCCNDL